MPANVPRNRNRKRRDSTTRGQVGVAGVETWVDIILWPRRWHRQRSSRKSRPESKGTRVAGSGRQPCREILGRGSGCLLRRPPAIGNSLAEPKTDIVLGFLPCGSNPNPNPNPNQPHTPEAKRELPPMVQDDGFRDLSSLFHCGLSGSALRGSLGPGSIPFRGCRLRGAWGDRQRRDNHTSSARPKGRESRGRGVFSILRSLWLGVASPWNFL